MAELPLITVKRYVNELDYSIILGFEAFTEEEQRKLLKYVMNATDPAYFTDAVYNRDHLIFKIERFAIDFNNDEVAFILKPATVYLELSDEVIKALKTTKDANVYVKAQISDVYKPKRGKAKIYISDVKFIVADLNEEKAKELLNDYDPLTLLTYALGYEPTPDVYGLILPRLLPIFKPFGLGVHVIQFTPPATGKTHTALTITQLENTYHSLSFPSRAKLIGDARRNSYGLCYKYNVLYIEEFDKISGVRADEFKEDYEALLTGLEQGLWQREKSSKADISYTNPVSFCVFGNVRDKELTEYTVESHAETDREKIITLIEALTRINAKPFVQRFCYVEYITDEVNIMAYIKRNENNEPLFLHPAVSRGVIKILKDEVVKNAVKPKAENSRFDRHFNTLRSILKTLKIELDDNTIERLVYGKTTFLDVFKTEKQNVNTTTEVKAEKTAESKTDDVTTEEWDMTQFLKR